MPASMPPVAVCPFQPHSVPPSLSPTSLPPQLRSLLVTVPGEARSSLERLATYVKDHLVMPASGAAGGGAASKQGSSQAPGSDTFSNNQPGVVGAAATAAVAELSALVRHLALLGVPVGSLVLDPLLPPEQDYYGGPLFVVNLMVLTASGGRMGCVWLWSSRDLEQATICLERMQCFDASACITMMCNTVQCRGDERQTHAPVHV
jgi:hypothetical protein